jgi:hypothetical protein
MWLRLIYYLTVFVILTVVMAQAMAGVAPP